MKRYTLAMKRKLVAEYATGDFPRKEFLSKHQIPNSTFHQWIHAYAEELLPALDAGMTVSGFRRLKNDCNRKQRIIEFLSLVNCTVNSHYRIKVAEIERIMRDQPKMFSIRTSFCFSRRIQQLHVRRSFSKAHNPYDNSICEAFFNSMKAEELYRRRYRSVREFKNSVATYIDEYNAKRPHATNHYLSPDEKESRWFAAKTDEAVRFCPENRKINSETEPPAQNPKV